MKNLVMAIVDFDAVNMRDFHIRASKRIVPGSHQSIEWEEYNVNVPPNTFSIPVLLELLTCNTENESLQPAFMFSLRATDDNGSSVSFANPVTMLIRSTKLADDDLQGFMVSIGVIAFPVDSPGNVWIITSRTADFTEIGFTRILAAKKFSAGSSGTLQAGALTIVVPARAFSTPLLLEVYEPEHDLDVPPGEKMLQAYALRAISTETGELVTKFDAPVLARLYSNGKKQYNVMPDGSLEYSRQVSNGELVHYLADTDTAWLITA